MLGFARKAVAVAAGIDLSSIPSGIGLASASIHDAGVGSEREWRAELERSLRRCGQPRLAKRLGSGCQGDGTRMPEQDPPGEVKPRLRAQSVNRGVKFGDTLRRHAIRTIADFGYPLRHLAENRSSSAFAVEVRREALASGLKSVLLISDRQWSRASEALMSAMRANPAFPSLLRVSSSSSPALEETSGDIVAAPRSISVNTIGPLMRARSLTHFDLVVIDGPLHPGFQEEAVIARSRVILLDRLDTPANRSVGERLLSNPDYQIGSSRPGSDQGYLLFRRTGRDPDCSLQDLFERGSGCSSARSG